MTSWFRVAWIMLRVVLHIMVALAIVALVFPSCRAATRRRFVRWWSRRVLAIFRLRLCVIGPPAERLQDGATIERVLHSGGIGAMLVMNHVSWLDIFVVHALRPARFVAKAEISRWPLLGYLTDRTGALFIERGKRHAVREVNRRAAEMLGAGDLIGVFPEGAVSDGKRLLPFHANLIQPAIDAAVPIVVAGLRYRDARGRPTTAIDYTGEVTLLQSIVRIATHAPLIVELHLIEAIDGATATRHEVARAARASIAEALAFDDDDDEAVEGLSTVIVIPDDAGLSRDAALARTALETVLDPRDELL